MKTVGLTGGIASGKSTVAGLLRAEGVPVLDADRISRQVVAPGSPGLAEVVAAFGPQVLSADGSLDRTALGRLVVDDPAARSSLEAITHPRIAAEITHALAELQEQGVAIAVVEAALMVETGSFRRYDAVLLVTVSPEVQRRRLAARQGWAPERVEQWLATQLSTAERARRLAEAESAGGPALIRVDNDGPAAQLPARVRQAWSQVRARLGAAPAPGSR